MQAHTLDRMINKFKKKQDPQNIDPEDDVEESAYWERGNPNPAPPAVPPAWVRPDEGSSAPADASGAGQARQWGTQTQAAASE